MNCPLYNEHGKNYMHKCTLSFKSFKSVYIKNSVNQIEQFIRSFNGPSYSTTFYGGPTCRKKYTVIRGPHIDKKSREQLELVKKGGNLMLFFKKNHSLLFFLFWLQNSQFSGVQIKITLNNSTTYTNSTPYTTGVGNY